MGIYKFKDRNDDVGRDTKITIKLTDSYVRKKK